METQTFETCIEFLLAFLEFVEWKRIYGHLGRQIEMMKLELNLLKMFFWGLAYLEESDCDLHLRFAIKSMMQTLMQTVGELPAKYMGMCTTQDLLNLDMRRISAWYKYSGVHDGCINLDVVMYDIGNMIEERLRPQARDVCILLLGRANDDCSWPPMTQKKFCEYVRYTTSFMELISWNLKALLSTNLVPPTPIVKQQIGLIQVELEKYGTSVNFAEVKKLSEILSCARTWCSRISFLTYLYSSDGNDESMSSITGTMLSGFLQENVRVSVCEAISSMFQPTMIPQLLARHLDFFLADLVLPLKEDVEVLQEALIFMLSYILDSPTADSKDKERIWGEIYTTFNKFPSLIYSISSDEMKVEICKANIYDFLMKVDRVKAKVRESFFISPYSSQFAAPNTNVIGFFSRLVENLSGLLETAVNLIPCIKKLYESLSMELESFQPHLKSVMELLQDDRDKEIKHLWRDMINMFYNVDYSTKLCLTRSFFNWWYVMITLSDIIEHMKVIHFKVKKLVGLDKVHNKKILCYDVQIDEVDALQENSMAPGNERGSMGFIEVEKIIIEELLWGSQSLSIISISGAGGQGKTTLAKRIFNVPGVRCHFQSLVWVYVSKDCPVKKLLVQILSCITKGDGAESEMEDLIVKIWRSLRGKRYLIILDDIWDVEAWEQLHRLFPEDKTGSRILFTTRNHDLASKAAKINSISHRLPLFSKEESWELMKNMAIGSSGCSKELVGIGKKIASHCRGLPLAVVLIAGVLSRTKQNTDSWNKVAENLKAHLVKEGCGNVLELSYRYLQDHLKPCFLYLAAFQRGEKVSAKELKLLWIGEGFVDHEDLATKYLKDLVSLGLVDVAEMSTMGEIKTCDVHDLLYDLCLEKVEDDKFMHLAEKSSFGGNVGPYFLKYNHHRLHIGGDDPSFKSVPIVIKRELPSSSLHTLLWTAGSYVREHFLASFRILTILKLKLEVNVFPQVFLSCIYLRHLELHFTGRIRAIPPTIANLWRLRTVIMTKHKLILPLSMLDMESLRYVDVDDAVLDLEGFDLKNSCEHTNIEVLGDLDLGTETVEILRKFANLRKLKCKTENMGPRLLSMVGFLLPELESLHVVHYGLRMATGWSFPDKMQNLTKLTLRWSMIPWSVFSEFGKQLPNLRVLKLLNISCVGKSWKLEDGEFSNLTYLKVKEIPIEEIDVSSCDNPLPCLEHLVLDSCRILEIPPAIGEIATLKTITVVKCSPELSISALGILEEQREFGNDSLQVYTETRYPCMQC